MSRGVSEGKQVITFVIANARNRDRGLIETQNVRFRQVLRHYCLLRGHVRSLRHPKMYQ